MIVAGLTKSFGSTRAVRDVSFEVMRGQVHALLGHNGSGKSTVVKIISGLLKPDAGWFSMEPVQASPARIGVVHQDLGLCQDATVLENCCMGSMTPQRSPFINWERERRVLQPVLDSLRVDFESSALVRDLSPANQTIVAIARALRDGVTSGPLDLLILDEATARLRGQESDMVLATARRVAAQGGAVLLVTHHMSEVLEAADRATVLASGAVVDTVDVDSTTEEDLLRMVSGRDVAAVQRTAHSRDPNEQPMLVLDDITGESIHGLSLDVCPGEVVGITGATGAGFEELPYLITRPDHCRSGSISVAGTRLRGRTYADSRRLGVGLVPADRLQQGLHVAATIRENLSPVVRRRNKSLGFIANVKERLWAERTGAEFQVRMAGPEASVGSLSGGNQQKVLLARVLEDEPRVLILHEPTQGVDEPTRRGLIEVIRAAASAGAAVLYISCDTDEVAGASDRVIVLREGRRVHEIQGGDDSADEIYAASYLTTVATS